GCGGLLGLALEDQQYPARPPRGVELGRARLARLAPADRQRVPLDLPDGLRLLRVARVELGLERLAGLEPRHPLGVHHQALAGGPDLELGRREASPELPNAAGSWVVGELLPLEPLDRPVAVGRVGRLAPVL